ncbi:MAG: hypothetical protein ABI665_24545 [Vicinamibacterales bacterium]
MSPALVIAPRAQEKRHARAPESHGRPAESRGRPAAPPPSALGPIGLPLPSIGLNLPPIGLSQPPIGLSQPPIAFTQPPIAFSASPVPRYSTGQPRRQPRHDGPSASPKRGGHWRPSNVWVVPSYPWGGAPYMAAETPPATSGVTVFTPEEEGGGLRLEVEPANRWQLFVDGVFLGSQEDLGNEVDLKAGPRRIELRAAGYHTLEFDARIEAGREITYRGRLEPLAADTRQPAARDADPSASAPPPVVATGSKTLYVIPGCYLGNVMPQKDRLRDGCDFSTLKTITP